MAWEIKISIANWIQTIEFKQKSDAKEWCLVSFLLGMSSQKVMKSSKCIYGGIAVAVFVSWFILRQAWQKGQVSTVQEETDQSHQKMLNVLQSVRKAGAYEHVSFAGRTLLEKKQELEYVKNFPDAHFKSLLAIAEHHLWLGETTEAISFFQSAFDLLDQNESMASPKVRHKLLFLTGLAHLRLGETKNCVHCNNGASCLLPIAGQGIHEDPFGSQQAVVHFEKALKLDPNDYTSCWLLNIAHMTLGSYPDGVPLQHRLQTQDVTAEMEFPRFQNIAGEIGLSVTSLSGGSIVDDFNGDGDLDVIVSSWGESDELQFFRNDNGQFVERSEQANFSGLYGGLNLIHSDYDNDGDLDLLVLRGAWLGEAGCIPNSLLENDGNGRFTDVAFASGIAFPAYPSQTAVWFDFDNDGDLDLYVGNENYPSQLFENINGKQFREIAEIAGVLNMRYAKGVTAGDYNEDGFPDIYVSNYGQANRLFRNNRDSTFTDVAEEMGVIEPIDSFPTWFWDYDQDGHLDLFVAGYTTDMSCLEHEYFSEKAIDSFHRLYRGNGGETFQDVTAESQINSLLPPMGANYGDIDNDGFPDFYLGTGAPQYEALMPNVMYWNDRGKRFGDVTISGGFGHLQKGHGISFADYDEDGDQDVFNELGGAYPGDRAVNCVYQNPGFGHHWIKVRLVGHQSNHFGIGVRIAVDIIEDGVPRTVHRTINSGGSFGANPLRSEIGLGTADRIERLAVFWPTSRQQQVFNHVGVDQTIEVIEGKSEFRIIE